MNRYFDCNATTPLSVAAKRAWLMAAERHWHNPSGLYREGGIARQRLEEARERLATLLGCDAERIVFTSGATESNNALFFSLAATLAEDSRVAISAIEHPSVREPAHGAFDRRVIELPAEADGRVGLNDVQRAIRAHRPSLVSVMAANNESGALQPWHEIASACRENGTLFHCDAAQWTGKLPSHELGLCDYVTGSAHKFGGPKGAGFLVLRDAEESLRFLRGGPQESGRRAGTENYPAIEAMVTALEELEPGLPQVAAGQTSHRDAFIGAMRRSFPGIRVIGENAPRLWNTVLLVMPRHDNLKWLTRLTRRGFAISTGSACSSGKEGSSIVVAALGASPEELRRVVRVSGGWNHTREDWVALADAFAAVGDELDMGGVAAHVPAN